MIVELVAGRIISRHVGQSLYTWTSVISVILAGISLGNLAGGWIADRWPRAARGVLAALFLVAALSCLTVPGLNEVAGRWTLRAKGTWPFRILGHVLLTFLGPAASLGAISPVVARVAVNADFRMGRSIGDLYAWGAGGAIAGTFLAGFVLIPAFGVTAIMLGVAGILAVTGLLYAATALS